MDDVRTQFGRILRKIRSDKGMTQEDLAGRAGMSVPYLSDLERGRWNPSLAMLVDLARGLSIHPSELLEDLAVDAEGIPPSRRRPEE
jgi:transcriptional regulator with XRE-family HTH domain